MIVKISQAMVMLWYQSKGALDVRSKVPKTTGYINGHIEPVIFLRFEPVFPYSILLVDTQSI